MENFDLSSDNKTKKHAAPPDKPDNDRELDMSVSAVCENKNGEKYAFVTFSDKSGNSAEGKIPDCRIIRNRGFSKEEVSQLEKYMVSNLKELKKMSAGIDIFSKLFGP